MLGPQITMIGATNKMEILMQVRSVYSELRDLLPILPFKKSGLTVVLLSITILITASFRWFLCGYSCQFISIYDWPSVLETMLISLVFLFNALTVLLFTVIWISILKRNSEHLPSMQGLNTPAIESSIQFDTRLWICLSIVALVVGKIPITGLVGGLVTIGAFCFIKLRLVGWRSVAASGVIGIVTAVVLLAIKLHRN